ANIAFGWLGWADPSQVNDDGTLKADAFGRAGGGGVADNAGAAPPAQAPPPVPGPAPGPTDPGLPMAGGPQVRPDVRETVFVNPTLITDSNGVATVTFPLAQSITSWRVSAEGSTKDGKLGAARLGMRTFQSFFIDFDVPTTFTRNDVVELPAVVYN